MTSSSMWDSLGAWLDTLGIPHAAASAREYAATASSRERSARPANAIAGEGRLQALLADAQAGRERECAAETGALPEGFVPIGAARSMALLGRWPVLDDKLPPCLPLKLLLTMQRRCANGDPEAAAWMKIYDRAFSGEVDGLRAFGRVCENGAYRAPADLQRAFFWYYRAALQGDAEARMGAERLMRATTISPAAMAEPALVYPGPWRITADVPGRVCSTSYFDLAENGAAFGCLIGERGAMAGRMNGAPSAFVGPCAKFLLSPQMRNAQYSGRWAYDAARKILSFGFPAFVARMPAWRSESWRIELLGCRMGALFGRDRRKVAYTLEYAAPGGQA